MDQNIDEWDATHTKGTRVINNFCLGLDTLIPRCIKTALTGASKETHADLSNMEHHTCFTWARLISHNKKSVAGREKRNLIPEIQEDRFLPN